MNTLLLHVRLLQNDESIVLDGIEFNSCALVTIDDSGLLGSVSALNEALVVPSELQRARSGSGKYLIFTNPSGIADDGGWTGVRVVQQKKSVEWIFHIDDTEIRAEFERTQYQNEIDRVLLELACLQPGIQIEPVQVVYPEDW